VLLNQPFEPIPVCRDGRFPPTAADFYTIKDGPPSTDNVEKLDQSGFEGTNGVCPTCSSSVSN
jgi:hypothetical protein